MAAQYQLGPWAPARPDPHQEPERRPGSQSEATKVDDDSKLASIGLGCFFIVILTIIHIFSLVSRTLSPEAQCAKPTGAEIISIPVGVAWLAFVIDSAFARFQAYQKLSQSLAGMRLRAIMVFILTTPAYAIWGWLTPGTYDCKQHWMDVASASARNGTVVG